MFANDATACFDKMVPGVSSLIARKFVVSSAIMQCRNETIASLERNIQTGCGDSKETYIDNEADDPMCGEVQGKGDVASLWCLMSHTILMAHRAIHTPIRMHGISPGIISMKKMMHLWMTRMNMRMWSNEIMKLEMKLFKHCRIKRNPGQS